MKHYKELNEKVFATAAFAPTSDDYHVQTGLSLLDYIAIKLIQKSLSQEGYSKRVIKRCYKNAKYILKIREQTLKEWEQE